MTGRGASADTDPSGAGMSTQPSLPPLGTAGLLRWGWRQLTSMRTALVLLFCLAVAAIPGSVFPQRGTNPLKVNDWLANNPRSGPVLDRLGFFDVYSSPWFSAVYLLLFISLVGCVVPRMGQHWRASRTPPPPAPRRMLRMPESAELTSGDGVDDVLGRAERHLRSGRWRVRTGTDDDGARWVAAEKGFLRETGNLVFHLSLLLVLVAVAYGGLFGWKGNVIVRERDGFSDTLTQYDAWGGGRFVDPSELPPFSFSLDQFDVDFERSDAQRGAPRLFAAHVTYRDTPASAPETTTIGVNEPLEVDGAKVFLVGHGYAPRFVVKDGAGTVVFDDSVVFLPQDSAFTSTGVVKVPDSDPSLGFDALFLPTAAVDDVRGPHSTFPAPDYPAAFISAWTGDLGMDDGVPQSVYALDTSRMTQLGLKSLLPGETWTLPDGAGSIELVGYERWASFQIAQDPGKELALAGAVLAICGLMASLFVRRRRLWVKAWAVPGAGTLIQVAALAKTEAPGLAQEVTDLARAAGEGSP